MSAKPTKGGVLLHMKEERNVQLESKIKKLFQMPVEADQHAINMMIESGCEITPALQKRMEEVNRMQSARMALMSVLNENEKMVIKRHVMDGVDWACLGAEYAQMWGDENQKSKRSLVNYYNAANKKMADYVKCNKEIFDFNWLQAL